MPRPQQSLFQVGQRIESLSSIKGYRGAWFRCEIQEEAWTRGQMKYRVRYYDYEDDELEWIRLYYTPPKGKRMLMLRPEFPPIYNENELPSVNAINEVVVVVDGGCSVGDKVDWNFEDCYWSGTVIEILDDDKVKIKLPDEPIGEGEECDASIKDLRPSLDWSPDSGWTLSARSDNQNGHSHARLIHPLQQAAEINPNADATPISSLDFNDSMSSHTSENSMPLLNRLIHSKNSVEQSRDLSGKDIQQTHQQTMELDIVGTAGKRSCSDSVSSTFVRGTSVEIPVASSAEKQDHDNAAPKKFRAYEAIPLNSTSCDSIESAIMDLEELVCRVKWLKQIIKSEGPSTSVSKKWEFVEHPAVSAQK